jgi:hypothetical protein
VFLDFSSAFNTFSRQSILDKLSALNIPSRLIQWVYDYFSNCSQFVFASGRRSEAISNNCGVLQGAVLSPIFFSLHTDSLISTNSNVVIKYADDTVIAGKCRENEDAVIFQQSVDDVHKWSDENGLVLNKSKCIEGVFTLRPSSNSNFHDVGCFVDGVPISSERNIKYLGVNFSSDCTWSDHIGKLFSKALKLTFVLKRLFRLRIPHSVMKRFVEACIFPVFLYCSPIIYPGLLSKDMDVLRRALKMISRTSGIAFSDIVEHITVSHIGASFQFAQRILSDEHHPLHSVLATSRSNLHIRNAFNFIYARTNNYKNSIVPFLARILHDKHSEAGKFKQSLL